MSETQTQTQTPTNGDTAKPAEQAPSALATAKPAPVTVDFDPDDPVALYMNSGVFAQLQRVAKMMAASSLVPEYLRGKEADCALIAAQAFRWRMDPFAAAAHSFALRGKLGYEGKLVAALVNSHPKIQGNLDYEYAGTRGTPERTVRVIGRLKGEAKDRTVEGSAKEWATDNEQWKKGQDQMLSYRGAREWARRHMPEVLLGIQSDDEITETLTLERTGTDSFGGVVEIEKRPALDVVTERLRAELHPEPAPPAAAAPPSPPPSTHPADAPDAEKDFERAVPQEPDPNTPEGNPFKRAELKARERAAKGTTGRLVE
jgi:hypothetical protein